MLMPLGDHASHWSNLLGEILREFPMHYPSWHKIEAERKARVLGKISIGMRSLPFGLIPITLPGVLKMLKTGQRARSYSGRDPGHLLSSEICSSETREYPSLIQTYYDTHTVDSVFLRDEERLLYEERLRLHGLGSNTSTAVSYTDDQIMAIVRQGKQRGHIPDVGRVLEGRGRDVLMSPEPRSMHTADVDELKRTNKQLKKHMDMIMKVVRSDDKMSQLLTQLQSHSSSVPADYVPADRYSEYADLSYRHSMPSIPTQSPFTYPNPNPSASPSFTQDDQDDTSESFIPEPTQPIPSFTQTAFSQPAFSQPNQSIFSQPDKYEIWAMKMEYWIQNADHNLWRIVQQGNSPKRLGKDAKGNTIVHPPALLMSMCCNKGRIRLKVLGGMKNQKKMRKTMLKQQFTEFCTERSKANKGLLTGFQKFWRPVESVGGKARPDNDDITEVSKRVTSSSWSQLLAATTHSASSLSCQLMLKAYYSNQQSIVSISISDIFEMEELDFVKWQMAMHSFRITRFEKKAGRKMNITNQHCHILTEGKVTEVKTTYEPKAWSSVDSWHKKKKKEWEVKFEATLARFEKWKGDFQELEKVDK
ncbi:hypothetical protein Tco_1482960 [Tanacetum coccineum]